MTELLAKIHPVDKQRGYHCRIYVIGPYKFVADRGWYQVDPGMAARLRTIRNNPQDPDSKKVFIVATQDEARAMDEAQVVEVAAADAPIPLPRQARKKVEVDQKEDLTTADLFLSEKEEDLFLEDEEDLEEEDDTPGTAEEPREIPKEAEEPREVPKVTKKKPRRKKGSSKRAVSSSKE